MHDETEDQDDVGATRAGDYGATSALPNSRPAPGRPHSSLGIREQTAKYARVPDAGAATPRNPISQAPSAGPQTPAPSAATRYCGACGAPLEPGRAYCGQCGTPASPSGAQAPSMAPSPSGSNLYRSSQPGENQGSTMGANMGMGSNADWRNADWDDNDGDAPTVAELPMDDAYGNYGGRPSYAGHGGYAGQGGYAGEDSSRTLRLLVGILCLVGSFATAVAAIILALATFHP